MTTTKLPLSQAFAFIDHDFRVAIIYPRGTKPIVQLTLNDVKDLSEAMNMSATERIQMGAEAGGPANKTARFSATENMDLFEAFDRHGFGDGDSKFAFDAMCMVQDIFEKFGYETTGAESHHNECIEQYRKKTVKTGKKTTEYKWIDVDAENLRESLPDEIYKAIELANTQDFDMSDTPEEEKQE